MTRMNRVLDVDIPNQRITVEPGIMNLEVTRRVAPDGYYYAPDPSSQVICSIGGNVAENSGGAHCLKYGFTVHHVVGVEAVLPDGEMVHLGGPALDSPGLDLLGVLVGSEGTLAVVTKVVLRLLRRPESVRTLLAAFDSTDGAGNAVSDVIAAGIIPAAIEMMDRTTIRAAEAAVSPGFPDAEAVLIVELDGPGAGEGGGAVRANRGDLRPEPGLGGAGRTRRGPARAHLAGAARRRSRRWGASPPATTCRTGVIPRSTLPEVLRRIRDLEKRSGLTIGNVFHAGDGNLHPLVCYDDAVEGQAELAEEVATEILSYCLDAGGSLTGEHGIGADKACHMPKMFDEADLATMRLLRRAFDPADICNPDKLLPTPRLCGEVPGPYRAHPAEVAGVAQRL